MRWLLGALLACAASGALADSPPPPPDDPHRLVVFVGERVSVESFDPVLPPNTISLDLAFQAHYRVLAQLQGPTLGQDVRFEVYDHYGRPAFSQFPRVLLFLHPLPNGGWVHAKYQFALAFRTRQGGWAGCGSPYDHEPEVHRRPYKPRPLDLADDAAISVRHLRRDQLNRWFPAADFERKGHTVRCRRGGPIADWVKAKEEGVLAARQAAEAQ